jgi:hypothetical protein
MKAGFENLGSDCYLNSVLTALSYCPYICNHYFLHPQAGVWADSIAEIWHRGASGGKRRLKEYANLHARFEQGQQDAHEALLRVHETLPEELADIVGGECASLVTCESCGHRVEPPVEVNITRTWPPSPPSQALPDYMCDSCGATGYCVRHEAWSPRPVQILHLRRGIDGVKKDPRPIDYPRENLFAVVRHFGSSLHSGHYTCTARYRETWMDISDDHVTPCKSGEPRPDGSEYLCFYREV